MLMIHIGVRRDELEVFEKQLDRFATRNELLPLIPISDYDSWEEWGEPLSGALSVQKDQTVHVTMTTMHPGRDIHILANQFEEFLVPMNEITKWPNLRAALTDASDWSQEYEEFRW